MSGEPALIRLLRETVEEEVPASIASASLFAALSSWGPRIPTTFAEVLSLVHGPLREALETRLGKKRGDGLIKALEKRLLLAERPTGIVSQAPKFDEAPTRSLPKLDHPVVLRVLAGTDTLAILLEATLGNDRVRIVGPDEVDEGIVVIDATDPPLPLLAQVVEELKVAEMVMLFGADLENGRQLRLDLAGMGLSIAGFDVEHGIQPILDLLRARRDL